MKRRDIALVVLNGCSRYRAGVCWNSEELADVFSAIKVAPQVLIDLSLCFEHTGQVVFIFISQ